MSETNQRAASIATGVFLVGVHAVSSSLLSHHFGTAILNALTIAACVLIMSSVERFADAKLAPLSRTPKKLRDARRLKNQPRKQAD